MGSQDSGLFGHCPIMTPICCGTCQYHKCILLHVLYRVVQNKRSRHYCVIRQGRISTLQVWQHCVLCSMRVRIAKAKCTNSHIRRVVACRVRCCNLLSRLQYAVSLLPLLRADFRTTFAIYVNPLWTATPTFASFFNTSVLSILIQSTASRITSRAA